jgi:hypothetical protein
LATGIETLFFQANNTAIRKIYQTYLIANPRIGSLYIESFNSNRLTHKFACCKGILPLLLIYLLKFHEDVAPTLQGMAIAQTLQDGATVSVETDQTAEKPHPFNQSSPAC